MNKSKIHYLLLSLDKNDLILGAYKAGESGEKEFVPLLLKKGDDSRMSTNLKFKGITVYQSKMIALRKIFMKAQPVDVIYKTDSNVINYYIQLDNSKQ